MGRHDNTPMKHASGTQWHEKLKLKALAATRRIKSKHTACHDVTRNVIPDIAMSHAVLVTTTMSTGVGVQASLHAAVAGHPATTAPSGGGTPAVPANDAVPLAPSITLTRVNSSTRSTCETKASSSPIEPCCCRDDSEDDEGDGTREDSKLWLDVIEDLDETWLVFVWGDVEGISGEESSWAATRGDVLDAEDVGVGLVEGGAEGVE